MSVSVAEAPGVAAVASVEPPVDPSLSLVEVIGEQESRCGYCGNKAVREASLPLALAPLSPLMLPQANC